MLVLRAPSWAGHCSSPPWRRCLSGRDPTTVQLMLVTSSACLGSHGDAAQVSAAECHLSELQLVPRQRDNSRFPAAKINDSG